MLCFLIDPSPFSRSPISHVLVCMIRPCPSVPQHPVPAISLYNVRLDTLSSQLRNCAPLCCCSPLGRATSPCLRLQLRQTKPFPTLRDMRCSFACGPLKVWAHSSVEDVWALHSQSGGLSIRFGGLYTKRSRSASADIDLGDV